MINKFTGQEWFSINYPKYLKEAQLRRPEEDVVHPAGEEDPQSEVEPPQPEDRPVDHTVDWDPVMKLMLDLEAKIDELADESDFDDDIGGSNAARLEIISKLRKGLDIIEDQMPPEGEVGRVPPSRWKGGLPDLEAKPTTTVRPHGHWRDPS